MMLLPAIPADSMALLATNDILLTRITRYHMASEPLPLAAVMANPVITSIEGTNIVATLDENGSVLLNGVAVVTQPDIIASNGVIHVLDTVLASDILGSLFSNPGNLDP